ncbi:MAG: tRNA (adenosine(37)-N6)-threonylcarbamoyltransferase complex transferase subunit TsaD [Trueperaceae bacterium]|nr:MAG: tRNA (adenosine(37)-N6)-threonylcarbamoyltransferase complex transferase subunit TsaD [Trueperaceae bacterium]
MLVVGIDTSCDDTGVGVVRGRRVLANVVASQAALHAPLGGVLPETASREHLATIDAVFTRALAEAGVALADLDAVAATYGPGLAGSLLVGLGYAKALAWGRGLPFVGVHHLAGHLAACLAEGDDAGAPPEPPYLCLIASGGHTVLFDVPEPGRFRRLGGSRDDAAGEAFDKVARLLGLPYPGGPALAALAEDGDAAAVALPRPMAQQRGYDFSFSGLKTAVAMLLERDGDARPADVAAAFQARVVQSLVDVATRAARATGRDTLVVAGGVAANRSLRSALASADVHVHLPPLALTTDNGAMIALAAVEQLQRLGVPDQDRALALDATPYLPLADEGPSRPRDARAG